MKKENIILIDNNVTDLELLEDIIYRINPGVQCISFIYADEAMEVICHELRKTPKYIFIDADVKRRSGTECLTSLRGDKNFDSCCISIFSNVMPAAVADTYKLMGANFAFQKPLTSGEGKEILNNIFYHEHKTKISERCL